MRTNVGKTTVIITVMAWISLIFIFSSQSYKEQSIQPVLHRIMTETLAKKVLPDVTFIYHGTYYSSKQNPFQFIEFLFRKSAHLFVYCVLAMAAARAMRIRENLNRRWPLPLILVIIVAALDELNQRVSNGRTPNPQDVLVDLTGGCIGLFVYLIGSYLYRRYKA